MNNGGNRSSRDAISAVQVKHKLQGAARSFVAVFVRLNLNKIAAREPRHIL